MAEKACHVVASTTQVGLIQALGFIGETFVNIKALIFAIAGAVVALRRTGRRHGSAPDLGTEAGQPERARQPYRARLDPGL